ncbi:MAG: DUF3501 family protein [Gammaproteobacteria bacterium]|nr:DUF3501 family protein [Gammaproteobacteria bacterium]MYD76060.1 DUF3501 family protein [Gammaproteobacteria bacterium]MYJ51230.1 DUF3501 family protein [Gammaproteobacteria bacterium]
MTIMTHGPLNRGDLMSLEVYAERREDYREQIIAHKKSRQVQLGSNMRLYFEDRLTMQYQIQEILRIEKIFEGDAIEEELEAYNPLIPDGSNWKVTLMIEYEDIAERKLALERLIGVERQVWIRIGDQEPVRPIANEDLIRETEEKTSAVHFLRYELSGEMIRQARNGADIVIGVDHPEYSCVTDPLPENIARSLAGDLLSTQ